LISAISDFSQGLLQKPHSRQATAFFLHPFCRTDISGCLIFEKR